MKKKIREIKTDAGDFKYISIIPIYCDSLPAHRKNKYKPTPDAVEKINEQNRIKHFEQLIHENADTLKYTLTLTYDDAFLPGDSDQIRRDIQNWIRRVRKLYKKANAELKYVFVSQYGEKRGRPHHHVIISGGVEMQDLIKSWEMGIYSEAKLIEYNEQGAAGLAKYISRDMEKENALPVIWRKRWSCSRNLRQPRTSKCDGVISQREVKDIANGYYGENMVSSDIRQIVEKRYDGYILCGTEVFKSSYNGDTYIYLKLYREDSILLNRWRSTLNKKTKRINQFNEKTMICKT